MRRRIKHVGLLAGLGAFCALGLGSCKDYDTGQDQEPEDLLVIKMTLFDNSRDVPFFTDTSSPDSCDGVAADDMSDKGKACNGPFTDKYSPKKSPPTVEAGADIRVIFNKMPLKVDGKPIQEITKKPMEPPTKLVTVQGGLLLECDGACTGVPEFSTSAELSGSDLSPDPDGHVNGVPIPFGPGLKLTVGGADPFASLEPETAYKITLGKLAGRNDKVVDAAKAANLLKFTVAEPFKILQMGVGDGEDVFVYDQKDLGAYEGPDLPDNGVIVLRLNAPLDPSTLKTGMTASVTASNGADVPARAGVWTIVPDPKDSKKFLCDNGNQKTVYVFPYDMDPAKRSWGKKAGSLTVTLKGADFRDLSQAKGHPAGMGKHSFKSDVKITSKVSDKPGDMNFHGFTADSVFDSEADCKANL